jgi:tetratricopeptide (TPR) repeat protein
LIRHLFLAAPLALCLLSAHASAAGKNPPPEYTAYLAAARKADAITDPLQRCLAYPDLPGNTWTPGLAKARCTMFLSPALYTLDAIDKTLAQPGGAATLETGFRALLDAHFSDPAQRDRIFQAFMAFNDDDHDKAERIARAWVAAAPESAFARTALGHVLAARGWDARGTKLAKDTPDDNLRKMEASFIDAGKEYMAAMEAEPRLFPACEGLMGIGRQSSSAVQAFAMKQCIAASPASYYVVEELMRAAEPRWGGSDEQMRAISAYAKAREQDNPMLALFAFEAKLYEIERLDDSDAQALAVLEPASQQVPNAAFLRLVGGAYTRKGDNWKALVYLSQALRFSPRYAQESRFRAIVLNELGESKWARADAERAVALDPKNGHALRLLGQIVRELDGSAAALPFFKRALEDSETREYAFNDYCGGLTDAKRFDEAGKCVDELLAAYPENPEGWRQRLLLIGFDAPQSMEAMERFVALNDPKRWNYHATAAETVRKVLALKNGTTLSPSDVYDARVTRARALEHLPAARPYQERIMAASSPLFEQSVGACRTEMKSGVPQSFSAVVDAQPNGTLGNVTIQPVNAWTSCFAKQFASKWKLPPPPEGFETGGYPLLFELRMK